ncbi:MAG: hypothetical protein MUD12_15165 [Spirochaetes bacterium]|jgi:hypothetical protein|nr:hypothetical protein [Spirochaetota bacterium]
MKKALVGALLIGMSLFSCYDSTANFARVMLLIGNPPANTTKLHVAAYAGFVSDATLIMSQVYDPVSIITLVIPNARILTFVIWVEEYGSVGAQPPRSLITHAGISLPVLINGEGLSAVAMQIQKISDITSATADAYFNLNYNGQTGNAVWTGVPGATYYYIQYTPVQPWEYMTSTTMNFLHTGTAPTDPWRVKACSSAFGDVCTDFGNDSWR